MAGRRPDLDGRMGVMLISFRVSDGSISGNDYTTQTQV